MKSRKYNSPVDVEAVLVRIRREGPHGLLSRGEVAAVVAARTRIPHDTPRTARNRVGRRLDLACKQGNDVFTGGLARRPDGLFTMGEIACWAQRRYPGLFDDFPRPRRVVPCGVEEGIGLGGTPSVSRLSGSLSECHKEITGLREQLARVLVESERRRVDHNQQLVARFKSK
jgi:hypothetical protein